jgi:hypothetical protein
MCAYRDVCQANGQDHTTKPGHDEGSLSSGRMVYCTAMDGV